MYYSFPFSDMISYIQDAEVAMLHHYIQEVYQSCFSQVRSRAHKGTLNWQTVPAL